MTNTKNDCLEYLIDVLAKKNNDNFSDFSTLKLVKLLFFVVGVSCSEEVPGLTSIFDNFVAMPYGPVESDVYNSIQKKQLRKYEITSSGCFLKDGRVKIVIDENKQTKIEEAVEKLLSKNQTIIKSMPFDLVDISHKWSCWKVCYNVALAMNKHSMNIPIPLIRKSVKYYK